MVPQTSALMAFAVGRSRGPDTAMLRISYGVGNWPRSGWPACAGTRWGSYFWWGMRPGWGD